MITFSQFLSESPVQYGNVYPVEWGFYDPNENQFYKPEKEEYDSTTFTYSVNGEDEPVIVEHHSQLARLLGFQNKEHALRAGLIAFETYSTGSSEVDGYTANKKTLNGMVVVLKKLKSATGTTGWTFYRKGLPGDTDTPEEAIKILQQKARIEN